MASIFMLLSLEYMALQAQAEQANSKTEHEMFPEC